MPAGFLYRRPAPATKCMFCGASPTTWEHLFSRWTHRFMQPRQLPKAVSHRGSLYVDRRDLHPVKLPGQVRDWQIKCVCGGDRRSCNGGWMKDLEDRARPSMIPLITGRPTRLSPQAQTEIATWAALKAMVSEHAFGRSFTHHMQRKRMMRRHLPPENGWAVWIGDFSRVSWTVEFMSTPFLVLPKPRLPRGSDVDPSHFNSNVTTQVIGKLFIQVVHSRMSNFVKGWRFTAPDGGTLFRIWPPVPFSIAWPGRSLTDRDADAIATAIPNFLLNVARERIGASR